LNSTKSFGAHDKDQQVHGESLNLDFNDVVDVGFQRMKLILCHNVQQEKVDQNYTQSWKGLVIYNEDHGTTTMSCYVASKYFVVLKLYQMQRSNVVTQFDAPQSAKKKKKKPSMASIFYFFNNGTPYKKTNPV